MDNNKLLEKIANLIDKKLRPIKEQLDSVEAKTELTYTLVEKSQKETIETLSDLMHSGYEMHEKRIKKLEEQATLP